MGITLQANPKTTIDEAAVRQRLFAFLSRPDGSIDEIRELTALGALALGEWMVGKAPFALAIAHKIAVALDRIDYAEGAAQ